MKKRELKPGTIFSYGWDLFGVLGPRVVEGPHPGTPDHMRGCPVSKDPSGGCDDDDVLIHWAPPTEPKPEKWLVVVSNKKGENLNDICRRFSSDVVPMAVVRDDEGGYRFFDTEAEALERAQEKAEYHPQCEYYVVKATTVVTREEPTTPPVTTTRL